MLIVFTSSSLSDRENPVLYAVTEAEPGSDGPNMGFTISLPWGEIVDTWAPAQNVREKLCCLTKVINVYYCHCGVHHEIRWKDGRSQWIDINSWFVEKLNDHKSISSTS